jgi:hypothetical protein
MPMQTRGGGRGAELELQTICDLCAKRGCVVSAITRVEFNSFFSHVKEFSVVGVIMMD